MNGGVCQRRRQRDDLATCRRGVLAYTIAPGIGAYGALSVGGLVTSNLTTLAFDLVGRCERRRPLVFTGPPDVNGSPNINFSTNRRLWATYKLMYDSAASPG